MNESTPVFYKDFADRFTRWAEGVDDIEAAFLIGSQARQDHPADAWSDMDILLFSTRPDYYLEQSDWLRGLGPVLASFFTYTAGGDPERLTLFDGGYQVDFVVSHTDVLRRLAETKTVHGNFHRGVRVLIDKNNISGHILPQKLEAPAVPTIDKTAFSRVCQMFWFAVQYVAKQILRDELWVAKARDADLKALLLQMIEWHEKALHGPAYDTWHAGRFLKEWASPDVYEGVSVCFAGFTQADSWRALIETASLFKRLSHEVAGRYGYQIADAEAFVELWVRVSGQKRFANA